MSAILIDGKTVAKRCRTELKQEVATCKKGGISVSLSVILVGDDPASQIYVRNKQRACEEVGIHSNTIRMPQNVTQEELLEEISKQNADPSCNGILAQLPLPAHLSEKEVLQAISPLKDVDGFHPENMGRLMEGAPSFVPCTAAGILELIHSTGVSLASKRCVVVGRSNIVGKPTSILLLQEDATVTIAHSKTKNLQELTKQADVLIVAVGRAGLIRGDMIRPGAVVIDVGMNRTEDGALCGDVAFSEAEETAGFLTPVPGGVGPMTIAMLLKNTVVAAKMQNKQIIS